jgi:hypothetical protein
MIKGALKTTPWNYKPEPQNPQGGTRFNPPPRALPQYAPNERSSVAGPEMRERRSLAMNNELNGPNIAHRFAPGPVHCSAGLGATMINVLHPLKI